MAGLTARAARIGFGQGFDVGERLRSARFNESLALRASGRADRALDIQEQNALANRGLTATREARAVRGEERSERSLGLSEQRFTASQTNLPTEADNLRGDLIKFQGIERTARAQNPADISLQIIAKLSGQEIPVETNQDVADFAKQQQLDILEQLKVLQGGTSPGTFGTSEDAPLGETVTAPTTSQDFGSSDVSPISTAPAFVEPPPPPTTNRSAPPAHAFLGTDAATLKPAPQLAANDPFVFTEIQRQFRERGASPRANEEFIKVQLGEFNDIWDSLNETTKRDVINRLMDNPNTPDIGRQLRNAIDANRQRTQ